MICGKLLKRYSKFRTHRFISRQKASAKLMVWITAVVVEFYGRRNFHTAMVMWNIVKPLADSRQAKLRSPLHDLRCLLPAQHSNKHYPSGPSGPSGPFHHCLDGEWLVGTSGCKGDPPPVLQLQCTHSYRLACSRLSWIWSIRLHKLSLWSAGANMNLPQPSHFNVASPRLRVCSKDAPVTTHRVSKRNVFWEKTGEIPCLLSGLSQAWHCDLQFFNLCWKPRRN